jgi:hypothetical protein
LAESSSAASPVLRRHGDATLEHWPFPAALAAALSQLSPRPQFLGEQMEIGLMLSLALVEC